MLRHQPYFDLLSTAEQDSPSWHATLAGLAVLRLVEAAREDPTVVDSDWTGVRAVAASVEAMREGSALRRPLMRIVDQLRDGVTDWSTVNRNVFSYGRALDLEGGWTLAADVFETVAEMARKDKEPELAMEATTALGGAARRSGDWELSAEGYAEAAYLANTLGDKASGLTVRVGTANTLIARGDLPAAQMILDDVVEEAERSGLDGVMAMALHSSASAAHLQGRSADTVTLGYRALEKTTNPSFRDAIMADIAAAFVDLGMRDAARDSHMIVSLTSRYQWVRWQATVNLMELAVMDGMESAFDDYAGQLKNAALDPRLRSYFLLYYGQGCVEFGRIDEGREAIAEARDFAASHKIHQVSFEAERALNGVRTAPARVAESPEFSIDSVPANVRQVAEALAHVREEALSAPPDLWWN
jgi:hypothetical protein